MRRVLNPLANGYEWIEIDGDHVRAGATADVSPTLAKTAVARSEFDHAKAKKNGFQFVGSVDMTTALVWHELYGVDIWDNSPEMTARLLKLLNDRDWRLFKATDDTL